MPDSPRSQGECPLPLEAEEEEEKALASKGSVSIEAGGGGWGDVAVGCAMYNGIPSKGALRSKNELWTKTTNRRWKNVYRCTQEVTIRYKESKTGL